MILASAAAFVVAAWLTSRFCRPTSRLYILDYPNERSLHRRPTPRTGGVAIFVGLLIGVGIVLWFRPEHLSVLWILAGIVAVAAVSYADDRAAVSPLVRLLVHVIGAGLVLAGGFVIERFAPGGSSWLWPLPLAIVASLVLIVWMVNLYNFMDGMDGLAGGMGVIGFGAFAVSGWIVGHDLFAAMNLVVAGSVAGFLVFNFPPARIFMGDVGSATLGLLAAAFSIWGAKENVLPLWAAVLVFSPFVVDATATLVKRVLRGERVWEAHKTHYYQRLVQLGWGHRKTVLWEYVLMLGCAASALWAVRQPVAWQWATLVGWLVLYSAIAVLVPALERRHLNENTTR